MMRAEQGHPAVEFFQLIRAERLVKLRRVRSISHFEKQFSRFAFCSPTRAAAPSVVPFILDFYLPSLLQLPFINCLLLANSVQKR